MTKPRPTPRNKQELLSALLKNEAFKKTLTEPLQAYGQTIEAYLDSLDDSQLQRLWIGWPLLQEKYFTLNEIIECRELDQCDCWNNYYLDYPFLRENPQLLLQSVEALRNEKFPSFETWLRPLKGLKSAIPELLRDGILSIEDMCKLNAPSYISLLKRENYINLLEKYLSIKPKDLSTLSKSQASQILKALNTKAIYNHVISGKITSLKQLLAIPLNGITLLRQVAHKADLIPVESVTDISAPKVRALKYLFSIPFIEKALEDGKISFIEWNALSDEQATDFSRLFYRIGLRCHGENSGESFVQETYLAKQGCDLRQLFDLARKEPDCFHKVTDLMCASNGVSLSTLLRQNAGQLEILWGEAFKTSRQNISVISPTACHATLFAGTGNPHGHKRLRETEAVTSTAAKRPRISLERHSLPQPGLPEHPVAFRKT